MEIFLVGGAVRDKLLQIPSPDNDWVVVGASAEEMESAGFKAVGKDFPVYLHPKTAEEYALARQERKSGPGYKGFDCYSAPSVTLEEDLLRRDLTINAIAMDKEGNIIDPYGGQQDLENRLLRHVSPAFMEDPVRVLRVARFAARFHGLGFRVAESTMELMRSMVDAGEIDHLVPERVWKEFSRALLEQHPQVFITVLYECGALARLMPELNNIFGVPQAPEPHPEIDTGRHSLLCLERAAQLSDSGEVRFAVLMHDIGKGLTPPEDWPLHTGHESRGLALIDTLCDRLSAPNPYRELALLTCEFHTHCHRLLKLSAEEVVDLLQRLDAYRREERFEQFCLACQADAQGRPGFENQVYPQALLLRRAQQTLSRVDVKQFVDKGLRGSEIGKAVHLARIARMRTLQAEFHQENRHP